MPVKFYDKEFMRRMRAGETKNLSAAGRMLKGKLKIALSIPSQQITTVTSKSGKTRKVYGAKGVNRSKPGDPPHRDTGFLRAHTFSKLKKGGKAVKVGTRAPHATLLEYGTKAMAARPGIRITRDQNRSEIGRILVTPIATGA